MQLFFGNMTLETNLFLLTKQPTIKEKEEVREVCLLDTLIQECFDTLLEKNILMVWGL